MHCVSIYPTPINEAHLDRINFLRNFSDNVGLSEHSNPSIDKLKISIASLIYKPKYIERHFTILQPNQSKDGPVSLNPQQLRELVEISKKNDEIKNYIREKIGKIDQLIGDKLENCQLWKN